MLQMLWPSYELYALALLASYFGHGLSIVVLRPVHRLHLQMSPCSCEVLSS